MANVEIDNKKMWEYLLNNSKDPNLVEDIANGLRAQGYDWKNGEITASTPETHWKNIPELEELESIGKQNLAEFEKKVSHAIGGYLFLPTDVNHVVWADTARDYYQKTAKELLAVARKIFLSEFYHDAEHYELSSTLESRYKARFEGYDDEDYKVWAAQDAQVALALARKQLISEIDKEDLMSKRRCKLHDQNLDDVYKIGFTDGIEIVIKDIKDE